jgi:hypothetical protein
MQNKRKYIFKTILILSTLFSCTSQITVNNPKVRATSSPTPESKPLIPTPAVTVSPSIIDTPIPKVIPTPYFNETRTISGKVFDSKGQLLDGVIVNARYMPSDANWNSNSEPTVNGIYEIKDVPCCSGIALTTRKFRFLESKQIIIIRSGIYQDVDGFNFGGTGHESLAIKEDPAQCIVCSNNETRFCSKTNPTDYQDKSTLTGKILDEKNSFLIKDAVVTLKSLTSTDKECISSSVTATDGTYTFKDVPVGANYEIKVTKLGYYDLTVNIVAKSNPEGNPDKNSNDVYLKS